MAGCGPSPAHSSGGGGGGGGGGGTSVNRALALADAFIVTVHEPVPVHAPDHPESCHPGLAAAVSSTGLPAAKLAEHGPAGQSMPAGLEVTRPCPATVTVSASVTYHPLIPIVPLPNITISAGSTLVINH